VEVPSGLEGMVWAHAHSSHPPRRVHDFVSSIFDHDLHEKRVASLADAKAGALQGARLPVGALGRALAVAKEFDGKHAIKQVDAGRPFNPRDHV